MLHCQAHWAARQKLQNSTGGRDINLTKLFTTTKTLHALFTFIAETGSWHSTFGDLLTLEEEQRRGEQREGRNERGALHTASNT
jgi:hypothetical protein